DRPRGNACGGKECRDVDRTKLGLGGRRGRRARLACSSAAAVELEEIVEGERPALGAVRRPRHERRGLLDRGARLLGASVVPRLARQADQGVDGGARRRGRRLVEEVAAADEKGLVALA